MVVDQFGMIGLLTFIRAGTLRHLTSYNFPLIPSFLSFSAETDPNLVSLALGADLTTLGLNLNSEVRILKCYRKIKLEQKIN